MIGNPEKISEEMRVLHKQFHIDTPRPGLLDWLTPPVIALRGWINILLMEKRNWTRLTWRHRFRAWRHGFTSFSYQLYELENNSPGEYLPDMPSLRFSHRPNGRYNDPVYSKVVFSRILKSLDAPQPTVLGILLRGSFYPDSGCAFDALSSIRSLLDKGEKLVLRPSHGSGGTGILFLEQSSTGYQVNSIPVEIETLETMVQPLHDYLVTAFVDQATYAAEIFPGSTNTLRILTLWDCELDTPFIAAACHRFGRVTSGPLDNFHAGAGGLSVPIDLVSGQLGLAVSWENSEIKRLSHHPDTGKAIEGIIVPDWNRTIDELLALATRLPYAPCVGWDLVKLEDGWTCLEGNQMPGYHAWQVHAPLLKESRVHRFYQEFGMLK